MKYLKFKRSPRHLDVCWDCPKSPWTPSISSTVILRSNCSVSLTSLLNKWSPHLHGKSSLRLSGILLLVTLAWLRRLNTSTVHSPSKVKVCKLLPKSPASLLFIVFFYIIPESYPVQQSKHTFTTTTRAMESTFQQGIIAI